jgi:hypothetical protein
VHIHGKTLDIAIAPSDTRIQLTWGNTMHYFEAYEFYFRSSKWWVNLLLGAVCILVPIAGPMVLMGWAFELLERSPREWRPVSDFDVNRLGKYIGRGVWPFLVQLVIAIPVSMVFVGLWFAVIVGTIATMGPGAGTSRTFFFVFPSYIIGIILISVFVQMISLPMCLRAGITQDFGAAFNFPWALDFIKRTWAEMLLSMLFFLVTSPFIALAGLILCCVGVYPAGALISMAHYHVWFQLYDLFLERGGESIPVKAQPVSDAQDHVKEN